MADSLKKDYRRFVKNSLSLARFHAMNPEHALSLCTCLVNWCSLSLFPWVSHKAEGIRHSSRVLLKACHGRSGYFCWGLIYVSAETQ